MSIQNTFFEKKNILWIILAIVNISLIIFLVIRPNDIFAINQNDETSTIEPIVTNTNSPQISESIQTTPTSSMMNTTETNDGILIFISLVHDQKSKIFLFDPEKDSYSQLFDDAYERIHPAVSFDQNKLAYSAKKNGYWDLYFLDLKTGEEIQLTDSPEYEGAPTWSPDNQFIAYETYKRGNLDINILNVSDLTIPPIEITSNTFGQFSPAWSPKGDQIAFVSSENGDEEVYLANLNTLDNRFSQVTDRPNFPDLNPTWSLDGEEIFWFSENNGYPVVLNIATRSNDSLISEESIGNEIKFTNHYRIIFQQDSNSNFLLLRQVDDNNLLYPPFRLPGEINGFSPIEKVNINFDFYQNFERNVDFLETQKKQNNPTERSRLVNLENLEVTSHYLHENIISAFDKFRSQISLETGWDFFYQLDKTYLPLTEPSMPGMVEDWLFTGRAFEFNPLSIHAGLVVTIKEERNGQTYWRIMVKTRYQDGSQGLPIRQMPFDLSSRYNNDPASYETGGKKISIPEGYWVDITKIGQSLNWDRVPALANWKNFFEATRFNQFAYTDNMDWYSAMRQIYPSEAIKTPSPLPTNQLTPTNSPTIRFFRSPTITLTPIATIQPTNRPTWTPIP